MFVELYQEGLIYRDKRLVNWDPQFQTAISDLEVETREVKGHFWHLRYPLADGSTYKFPIAFDEAGKPTEWEERDYIVVATTRPETMLGDTGVAVHPDGRALRRPGRQAGEAAADRPAHLRSWRTSYADPDQRHGRGEDHAGARLQRLSRSASAHKLADDQHPRRTTRISIDDGARGLYRGLERVRCAQEGRRRYRGAGPARTPIEDTHDPAAVWRPLAGRHRAVPHRPVVCGRRRRWPSRPSRPSRRATTKFVPENWAKTYYEWMRNIEPWCVSRQLWWGHQHPGLVRRRTAAVLRRVRRGRREGRRPRQHYGKDVELVPRRRRPRHLVLVRPVAVLDHGLAGRDGPGARRNSIRAPCWSPAFDIIFFWVARMMMQGIHFMGEVPFKDVYIHALVRDEKGQKMSKSKGNVIDPLELVDEFGADALRMTLARRWRRRAATSSSRSSRVEGYRNFSDQAVERRRSSREMNECAPEARVRSGQRSSTR